MSDFIRCYPDMIPATLCREIIAKFASDPRKQAGRALVAPQAKRSVDLLLREHSDWSELCDRLDPCVVASLKRYRAEVPNFQLIHRAMRDTGYQLQAYEANGTDGFDWHADATSRTTCDRFLAMVAYLNTVDVGGETEFAAQQQKIAPREGAILWFPPGFQYMHRGRSPESGPKYIITLFLVYP